MMIQSKNTTVLLVIVLALIVLGGGYLAWQQYRPQQQQVACDTVAKLCPDGSSVGRSGPNCEFAACPPSNVVIDPPKEYYDWQTTTTPSGVTFQYPNTLPATYIETVDWPPKVQVVSQAFTCTESGSEILPAGKTTKATIGTTTYCVTQKAEGAAGSTYTQYTYALARGTQTMMISFTLRTVQCANYDEPEKTTCAKDQSNFDLNDIVNHMTQAPAQPN